MCRQPIYLYMFTATQVFFPRDTDSSYVGIKLRYLDTMTYICIYTYILLESFYTGLCRSDLPAVTMCQPFDGQYLYYFM